jgi:hypothetical protein
VSGSDDTQVPPVEDERRAVAVPEADIRRRWLRMELAFIACVVLASVLALVGLHMRSHEQVLDQRGVDTDAVVVDTSSKTKGPDEAMVEYDVEGQRVRAALTVDDDDRYAVGSTVRIRYDPANPRHARPLEGWDPTYGFVFLQAVVLVALAPFVALYGWWVARRNAEVARSGETRRMHAEAYRRTSAVPPYVQHLVALWPEGVDSRQPPELSVEVPEGIRKVRPGPVTVVGRPEPGAHIVLRVEERTIWTHGKVKRGLHPKAKRLS